MDFSKDLEQFKTLFQGSKTYYGQSKPTGTKKLTGKEEYKSWTIPVPVTDKDWINHLEGKSHLGSVVIHDDSTCTWGVIDIDRYGMDLKQYISLVRERGYPFVPYRSKSNG
jgi:hypothetical protein